MLEKINVNYSEILPSLNGWKTITKSNFDSDEIACSVFTDLIRVATDVFTLRLVLGGAHNTNQDDKEKALEHLQALNTLLDKYKVKVNEEDDLYNFDPEKEPWWNR